MFGMKQQLIIVGTAVVCAALFLLVIQWARKSSMEEKLFGPMRDYLAHHEEFDAFLKEKAAKPVPKPKPKGATSGGAAAAEPTA